MCVKNFEIKRMAGRLCSHGCEYIYIYGLEIRLTALVFRYIYYAGFVYFLAYSVLQLRSQETYERFLTRSYLLLKSWLTSILHGGMYS